MFKWNEEAKRYVDARGRFVSRAEVRRSLDFALRNAQREMRTLAQSLRSGNISLAQWQARMRVIAKNVHLYSAAAARGGFAGMRAADYGSVGARLRFQYKKIDEFAAQIARGYPLDGRFLSRVDLYAQSGRSTYHTFDGRMHKASGYIEERYYLGVADHCGECVAIQDAGWQPIGSLTPIGSRQCLSRCACSVEYR